MRTSRWKANFFVEALSSDNRLPSRDLVDRHRNMRKSIFNLSKWLGGADPRVFMGMPYNELFQWLEIAEEQIEERRAALKAAGAKV